MEPRHLKHNSRFLEYPNVFRGDRLAFNTNTTGTAAGVSGPITANIGTTGGLALEATQTNGTAKAIALPYQSSTTVVTTVPSFAATVSTLLIAANPNRKALFLWNNSANSIYLSYALTSNSSTPTFILATFATFGPGNYGPVVWTGPISGIRNAGTGSVTVYEVT